MRRFVGHVIVIAIAIVLGIVGGIAPGAHALAAQTGSVEGVVYDSVREIPLAGATVLAEGTPNAVRTDSAGHFRLDALAAGTLVLSVASESLDSLGIGVAPVTIELREGERRAITLATPSAATLLAAVCAGVDLADAEGLVSGVVRDDSARVPVAGAVVEAGWESWVPQGTAIEQRRAGGRARSGVDGTFFICGVRARSVVTLRAIAGGRASVEVGFRMPEWRIARRDVSLGAPEEPRLAARAVAGADPRSSAEARGGVRLDRARIAPAGSVRVPELLRAIPGFRLRMGANGATAVWTRQRRDCTPLYYLDGLPVEEANTGRSTDVEEIMRTPRARRRRAMAGRPRPAPWC